MSYADRLQLAAFRALINWADQDEGRAWKVGPASDTFQIAAQGQTREQVLGKSLVLFGETEVRIYGPTWEEVYRSVLAHLQPPQGDGDPYCTPEMERMRTQSGASVCTDSDCDLSGGYAHVGYCVPCDCGLRHALEECPAYAGERCLT